MTKSESKIEFCFGAQYGDQVIKYDDTEYYRELFESQPGAKAVDFIAISPKHYVMIEVKNCVGDESNNRWRIASNNRKVATAAPAGRDVSDRDSLDIEVAKKTAMTIAGMMGVYSKPVPETKVLPCMSFAEALCDNDTHNRARKLVVILVFDGKFGCQTRSERTIRLELQRELKKKLKWLNAEVIVTESAGLHDLPLGISAAPMAV